jgi:hypothetical protein
MSELDFNTAGPQRSFEVIPAGTVCEVQLNIKAGGAADDSWLTCAAHGNSEHLHCEYVIVRSTDGKYDKRKFWERLTVQGTTAKHNEARDISWRKIRAMIESARGIRPDNKSETANAARKVNGYAALDGLRFMVRLGIEPASGGYPAKNFVAEVVTPEQQNWRQVEQISAKSATVVPNAAQPTTTPPANAIVRPDWAG